MEIEINKQDSLQKVTTEYLKIENYRALTNNKNLLLVIESQMHSENQDDPFIQIFKIQFIASCKTKFKDKILVAFYSGEFGVLHGFIISDLPIGYFQTQGCIVDYDSYIEICEITKETKLSFIEYYEKLKIGVLDMNSFMKHDDKYLNLNEQQNFNKF